MFRTLKTLLAALWATIRELRVFRTKKHTNEVAELTATVLELHLRDDASQAMAGKIDRFLATLGHELRGPLSPLLMATEQLSAGKVTEERSRQLAGIASRQARQLGRLIDDLCDMNRVHHGHISVRLAPLDLTRVIEEATEAIEPLLEAKGQRLSLRVEAGEYPVTGDSARLIQVLFNLLTNASRYSNDGALISVEASRIYGHAVITVTDQGIGISPENLGSIFELFKQVAPLSKKSEDGFGVGLALAQELVRLHHGRLEAVSEGLGRGSTFRILLPLTNVSEVQAVLDHPPSIAPPLAVNGLAASDELRSVRSVVVDDDADSAEGLASVLETLGVEVRLAYDGLEALSAVEEFQPQLVFLDLSLPLMSGLEVARKIRTAAWGKAVQLVALTGSGSASDREACLDSGFDAQFTKPLELSALKQLVAGSAV